MSDKIKESYTEEDMRNAFEAAREKASRVHWTRHADNHYTWHEIKYLTFEDYLNHLNETKKAHKTMGD